MRWISCVLCMKNAKQKSRRRQPTHKKKKKKTYLKVLRHQELQDVTSVSSQRALLPLAKVGLHHSAVVEHPHEFLRPNLPPLHLGDNQSAAAVSEEKNVIGRKSNCSFVIGRKTGVMNGKIMVTLFVISRTRARSGCSNGRKLQSA